MNPFTKILVPTDFSEHAAEALSHAIDLATRYSAELAIVHVFDLIVYPAPDASAVALSMQVADAEDELKAMLEKQRRLAVERGVQHVEATMLRGHPPTEIVKHATAIGADLIVMGTHGRRGVSHFLIGSVAERVVRTAPCGVLTVRLPIAAKS